MNNRKVFEKYFPQVKDRLDEYGFERNNAKKYVSKLPLNQETRVLSTSSGGDILFRIDTYFDLGTDVSFETKVNLEKIVKSGGVYFGSELVDCEVYFHDVSNESPYRNVLLINGRIVDLKEEGVLSVSDIEFFMILELKRARGLTKILKSLLRNVASPPKKMLQDAAVELATFTGNNFINDRLHPGYGFDEIDTHERRKVSTFMAATNFEPDQYYYKWNDRSDVEEGVVSLSC